MRTAEDGTRIFLKDVAEIRDAFVDQEILGRFDGDQSVSLQVQTSGEGDIIKSAEALKKFVDTYGASEKVQDGVILTWWDDGATPIRARLGLLVSNGLTGMALVLVVLALFLNLRLAFWVALGIPVSIAGALALFSRL